jgi:hypothetical protein
MKPEWSADPGLPLHEFVGILDRHGRRPPSNLEGNSVCVCAGLRECDRFFSFSKLACFVWLAVELAAAVMLILKDLGRAEEIPPEPSLAGLIGMWQDCLGVYPGFGLQTKFRARDKINLDNPVLLRAAVAFGLDLRVYNAAASSTKPVSVLALWEAKNIAGLGQVLKARGLSQPVCLYLDRGHISAVKPCMSAAYGRVGGASDLVSRAQASPKIFFCWNSTAQSQTIRLNLFMAFCTF